MNYEPKKMIFMLIGSSLYLALEYWIGKTKKVNSNSVLELIWVGVAVIGAYLIIKWKERK